MFTFSKHYLLVQFIRQLTIKTFCFKCLMTIQESTLFSKIKVNSKLKDISPCNCGLLWVTCNNWSWVHPQTSFLTLSGHRLQVCLKWRPCPVLIWSVFQSRFFTAKELSSFACLPLYQTQPSSKWNDYILQPTIKFWNRLKADFHCCFGHFPKLTVFEILRMFLIFTFPLTKAVDRIGFPQC